MSNPRKTLLHINRKYLYVLIRSNMFSVKIGRAYLQIGPTGVSTWWTLKKGVEAASGDEYELGTHHSIGFSFWPKKHFGKHFQVRHDHGMWGE